MIAPSGLLDWAAEVVGTHAFDRVDALAGGSAAGVWRLSATTEAGPLSVVAKQIRLDAPPQDAHMIASEARVLEAIRPLGLPVPEPLACDPEGICSGAPAMIMNTMPGALLQGASELRAAIPEYVRALVLCHQRAIHLLAGRRFRPWFDIDALEVPDDLPSADLWRRAVDLVRRFPAPTADGFIHRDPHPANMLFSDGRLTAILDWPHAGRGPRGFDVSRVALNLACLLDVDATRELRERYEAETGSRHDPLLDVHALLESDFTGSDGGPDGGPDGHPTWRALGMHLDAATVRTRLDAFLADALHRMTVRRLK